MTGFGAKAYSKVSAETGARAADAHQLVLMLYDGAVEAARLSTGRPAARLPSACPTCTTS